MSDALQSYSQGVQYKNNSQSVRYEYEILITISINTIDFEMFK